MLCENCIVDASIFIFCFVSKSCSPVASSGSLFVGSGGVVVVCLCKGTWWMPWHTEPMKDVRDCVMPRGAVN